MLLWWLMSFMFGTPKGYGHITFIITENEIPIIMSKKTYSQRKRNRTCCLTNRRRISASIGTGFFLVRIYHRMFLSYRCYSSAQPLTSDLSRKWPFIDASSLYLTEGGKPLPPPYLKKKCLAPTPHSVFTFQYPPSIFTVVPSGRTSTSDE